MGEYITLGFPSWREFIEKERMFYKEIDNQLGKKVEGLSDKQQIVTIAFKTSLHVLPQPFDAIADSIYESVEGYDKEKLSEVKEFLHTVKKRGEYHYKELAPKLSKNAMILLSGPTLLGNTKSTLFVILKSEIRLLQMWKRERRNCWRMLDYPA